MRSSAYTTWRCPARSPGARCCAALLGLSAPVVATLLAACGGSSSQPTATTGNAAATVAPTVSRGTTASTPGTTGAIGGVASPGPAQTSATPAANLKPPAKDQTLIFPYPNSFRTLDPAAATESGSIDVTHSCYEGLTALTPHQPSIEPRLAKSWDVTPDASQFTFHLQQGVKFQDGTVMDANAVKSSFDRVTQMNLGNASVISGVDKIEVLDPATIRFTLKEPDAYFPVSCTQISIISPTAWQKNDRSGDFGKAWLEEGHTAGTGPWSLTGAQKDVQYSAEKFTDYWRGWSQPHITKILWPIVPEATTRRQMLEKGQAHIVTSLPLVDANALESNSAVQVLYSRGYGTWTMPMVVSKAPTDNLKVRQALQYAFDYEGYLNQVWFGHGTLPNGPTAQNYPGYVADAPPFKQDLNKAKQLLTEAGVSNNLSIQCSYIDTSAEEKQSAVILQDALKKIGVDLSLQAMPWATMFKLIGSLDTAPNMTNLQSTQLWPDPVFTLELVYGSALKGKPYNWSYYGNAQVDSLINQARSTPDKTKAGQPLVQANQQIIADAPVIWYALPDRYDTISARIQNFGPIPVGYPHEIDYFTMYLSE